MSGEVLKKKIDYNDEESWDGGSEKDSTLKALMKEQTESTKEVAQPGGKPEPASTMEEAKIIMADFLGNVKTKVISKNTLKIIIVVLSVALVASFIAIGVIGKCFIISVRQ